MKYLKTHKNFVNEELNLRKAAVGGAIALSTLGGCSSPNTNTSYDNTTPTEEVTIDSSKFKMVQNILTIGTDMEINNSNGDKIGIVEERVLNWGKTFEYLDNNDKLIAKAKQKVLSLYTVINIYDDKDAQIGSVEQEVLESLFSIKSIYSIKDASGKVIAKSKKLDFFTTDVDIYDTNDKLIATLSKEMFTLVDKWDIDIKDNTFDKRLIIFIPPFVSSAQAEKEDEEDSKKEDDE